MTENEATTQPTLALTPPSRKQIDALILEYAAAQADLQSYGAVKRRAGETAADIEVRLKAWSKAAGEAQAAALLVVVDAKTRLLALVAAHGARHAEKSMRLSGEHNQATVTRGTHVETRPAGVANLKAHLDDKLPGIVELFFTEHISYSLVAGPAAVLKTLEIGERIRTKLTALIALCFEIKTKAPGLKIDAVAAAKPSKAA
jgi:hypothetical protein